MLQKSKSKKIVQLKYLLLIPVVGIMLTYTSCTQQTNAQEAEFTATSDSEIIRNIEILTESIAKKGGMSKEEEDALKVLHVMTSREGVQNPEFEVVKDKVFIPLGVIEKVPTYPGCEGLSDNKALKKCFIQGISKEIVESFDTKIADKLKLSGDVKIMVNFKVNREGKIINIRSKADHADLEQEAVRVVKMLPVMIPGEQDGKKVGVDYSLPIKFKIK